MAREKDSKDPRESVKAARFAAVEAHGSPRSSDIRKTVREDSLLSRIYHIQLEPDYTYLVKHKTHKPINECWVIFSEQVGGRRDGESTMHLYDRATYHTPETAYTHHKAVLRSLDLLKDNQ